MTMTTNRISRLLQFLNEDPSDPFVRFALATEYLKAGHLDEALTWFEKLLEDRPDYIGTYYHLGKLYLRLGREEDALETFDGGIEAALRVNDFHTVSELRSAKMEVEVRDGP